MISIIYLSQIYLNVSQVLIIILLKTDNMHAIWCFIACYMRAIKIGFVFLYFIIEISTLNEGVSSRVVTCGHKNHYQSKR